MFILPIRMGIRQGKATLTQLQPNQINTHLGVVSQHSRPQKTLPEELKSKASKIGKTLSSIHLPQYYAHLYHICSINPKLGHPLAASSISSTQLNSIQSQVHPEVLASSGYNRKLPKSLRYGRHICCGSGLLYLGPEQSIRRIQTIHKLITHTKRKILITGTIYYFQLSSRQSISILESTNQPIEYVSSVWIRDLIFFNQ